jgi:hypothetical protein
MLLCVSFEQLTHCGGNPERYSLFQGIKAKVYLPPQLLGLLSCREDRPGRIVPDCYSTLATLGPIVEDKGPSATGGYTQSEAWQPRVIGYPIAASWRHGVTNSFIVELERIAPCPCCVRTFMGCSWQPVALSGIVWHGKCSI